MNANARFNAFDLPLTGSRRRRASLATGALSRAAPGAATAIREAMSAKRGGRTSLKRPSTADHGPAPSIGISIEAQIEAQPRPRAALPALDPREIDAA